MLLKSVADGSFANIPATGCQHVVERLLSQTEF
jgi:hypothetical protein